MTEAIPPTPAQQLAIASVELDFARLRIAELEGACARLRAELAHAKVEINDWRVYFARQRERDEKFLALLDAANAKWEES